MPWKTHWIAAVFVALAIPAVGADWRHDLPREAVVGEDRNAWRDMLENVAVDPAMLERAFGRLGAERFPEREEAQRSITAAGREVLDWLLAKEPSEDPEVRFRVGEIVAELESGDPAQRERMLRHAARSLLRHGDAADTGGIFYEWFGRDSDDVAEGYRLLDYMGPDGKLARVKDRQLILNGERPGDHDQRLILHSEKWPGAERFPDRFIIKAGTSGTGGGGGTWHLGITIGKVKALYHPGYRGGGFRFEQVGTRKTLAANKDMGFTPATEGRQWMMVEVGRLKDGGCRLDVTVTSHEGKKFRDHITVTEEIIGPLTSVSLDRSGRSGGDAVFEDFSIEIR